MRKYASLEVLEAWRQAVPGDPGSGARRIVKAAHRVTFDYEPRPGYLYLRSRMISSRTNDNHDTFPADEIEKGYKTFLGKPVFVNHNNENHRRARGVIVAVALHRDKNPDGTPDTWVEGLHEVDAVRFPKLAKAVLAGRVNRTSMGVDVDWSTCSACGNKATSPAEYCKHLPALKGKKIRQRNKTTGKLEEKLIHEVCAGLSFFENSLLVEDPADPTAAILDKPDDRGMRMAAGKTAASDDEPDFRDHLGNTCRNCGDAVAWIPGNTRHPPRFKHDSGRLYDHDPDPVNPQDKSGRMAPSQFGGTHCLFCGDPVRINLHSLSRPGNGWYHEDGMKREGHDAYPADPQKVYDSVPGVRAQYDQARSQMKDHMHGLFEQLEGRPLPRSPRGDEHQMPQDPFTASRKTAEFTARPVHCTNCGTKFGSMYTDTRSGNWPHQSLPFLCNNCALGHTGTGTAAGKPSAVRPLDKGGTQYHPVISEEQDFPEEYETGPVRRWEPGDAPNQSLSSRKKQRGQQPKPVRGYGRDPKFDGVALKRDKNGFYVHTHRSRSDSYPTVDDIPDKDIEQIRATGSVDSAGGTHCVNCGRELDSPEAPRSRTVPMLCQGCLGRIGWKEDSALPGSMSGERARGLADGSGSRAYRQQDMFRHSENSLAKAAYGETRVPPQVDTLRMDECPVCGEHNVWSGSRCPVCGFVVPPSVFRDPDTSKAGGVRDQLDSAGDVTLPPDAPGAQQPDAQLPVAQVGSGQDADGQLVHPDQIAPDGVPTVQGGDPGETDGQPPDAQEDPLADPSADPGADPEAGEEEQNLEGEGDVPPEDPAGELEDQPGDDLICPACGTTFETDAAAQPGVPCPACGMASLHLIGEEDPGGEAAPPEGAEDPSGDGEEEPEAEQDEEEDKDMPASKTAAVIAQAQARRIAELSAQNEVLHAQLSFLASAAGIAPELAEVGRRVMRRHADILNPAQPVPDPPEGPPSETTEQALMPESMDNAGRPGTTPGANSRVPAEQTTTPVTPGVEMQTPPATNLIDVTAPVQGTNPSEDGGVPLQQRRIETDVRIDPDPLKAHGPGIGGQGDNGAAFPWILDARGEQGGQPGAQKAASLEADASRRTFASIRLAKMRVQAGLAQGDELAVAERIEKDASTPTDWIEREISVLSQTPVVQQRQAARPVARTASRAVPSLASVGASASYAPAVMDDLDASDLFD